MKKLFPLMPVVLTAMLVFVFTVVAGAQTLPLDPLPDEPERDYWFFLEVNEPGSLEALQEVVSAPPVPLAVELEEPIEIAVVYPSHDVSDIWLRTFMAMTARLDELEVPYNAVEFASGADEYELQYTQTETVIEEGFDYVVFGSVELTMQQGMIEMLIDAGIPTLVFNQEQVVKDYGDKQPLGYFGYSHLDGAQWLARYIIDRYGPEGTFALVRGVPGFIDDLRSQGFRDYMEVHSDWEFVYEHYGHYMREGGYEGGIAALTAYPEVDLIHPANTAMSMGVLSALMEFGLVDDVILTGWGGTGDELEAIKLGEMQATPMRMNDDMGAAMAEAIKYHLEGREDELPLVFVMRIEIVNDEMREEEIAELEEEAFRYSGTELVR